MPGGSPAPGVAGVAAWGAYLPGRTAIKRPDPGCPARTAAAWDEDTFTMAVEAARRCLAMYEGRGGAPVDSVFVVRAREPLEAGDRALLVALGLPDAVRLVALPATGDGQADALDLALSAVQTRRAAAALVVGASCAVGDGDGAAAVVVSADPLLALEARAVVNLPFLWDGGPDGALAPARYEQQEVVAPRLREVVDAVLAGAGADTADLDTWALSSFIGPAAARGLGLRSSSLGGDQPFTYAPGADLLLRVVLLCSGAGRRQRLLALNVGERAWASVWRVVADAPDSPPVSAGGATLDYAAYTREIARRGLEPGRVLDPMDYVRDAPALLRGEGARCGACGRVTARARATSGTAADHGRCDACGGDLQPVSLGREATVAAFTRSELTAAEQAQPTTYLVCDIDGGGRLMSEIAGGEDGNVAVGSRVTLTLRRGYREDGRALYFWKAVPHG